MSESVSDRRRAGRLGPRQLGRITWDALMAWIDDGAMRLSASLAMYTMLSLSPLLVITVKVISVVLEEEAASRQISRQVAALLGPLGAQALNDMIVETSRRGAGVVATVVSTAILLVTASGVFAELQGALNTVWRVQSVPSWDVVGWLKNRLLSMAMVLIVGFLLLVSQALTTALTVTAEVFAGGAGWMSFLVDTTASMVVITLVFGFVYRVLPDVKMEWRDVLLASVLTAALFKVGQYVLALYFARAATTSAYGAAGSFVALLLWVYYSCWIVFFGAEFTKVYARHRGRWVEPEPFATKTDPHDRSTPVVSNPSGPV
jgi:membrane protein